MPIALINAITLPRKMNIAEMRLTISFTTSIENAPPPINLEIDTELTNEMMAINMIESRNETVPIITLMTPTIHMTTALVASNDTTLSAVVGPLINLKRHTSNAIPK